MVQACTNDQAQDVIIYRSQTFMLFLYHLLKGLFGIKESIQHLLDVDTKTAWSNYRINHDCM